MPDPNRVLTALRDELVAAGLARRPSVAGAAPPVFVEPADGPPAPGEREGTEAGTTHVLTLRLSSTMHPAPGRRIDVVDLVYRSRSTAGLRAARALHAAIIARLAEAAGYGVGVTLDAAGTPLHVIEVSVFGGLGPVSDVAGTRTELAKLALEVLAG